MRSFLTFVNLSGENLVEDHMLLVYGAMLIDNLLTNFAVQVTVHRDKFL